MCTNPKAPSLITLECWEVVPASFHRAFHFGNEHLLCYGKHVLGTGEYISSTFYFWCFFGSSSPETARGITEEGWFSRRFCVVFNFRGTGSIREDVRRAGVLLWSQERNISKLLPKNWAILMLISPQLYHFWIGVSRFQTYLVLSI